MYLNCRSENSEDSAGTDSDFHLEKEDFPALGSQVKRITQE